MNRFERDILENEMGLNRTAVSDAVSDNDEKTEDLNDGAVADSEVDAELSALSESEGEQLKIDDAFLGSASDDGLENGFFLYGYQDELDMSSLNDTENETGSDDDGKEVRDGSGLFRETVILIESGEIALSNGIALLKKNAGDGHALSWVYLGQIYSNKKIAIYNPTLAFECYSNAAKLDLGEGHYNLGLCYSRGFGCEKSEDEAANCFSDGARVFNADSVFALGMCYEFGIGREINYEYAFNLYEKGYELGHAGAANNLGGCYFHGHGVERDEEKAIEIFTRAAEMGSSYAECRLGIICEEREGDRCDINRAIEHYKTAAKNKNPVALYRLGLCYRRGNAIEQSFNQAYKCFSRSAALGYAPAKYEAGKLCVAGKGAKKNPELAYKLFVSAAEGGYAPAQYEVANCLLEGIGTMVDKESAFKYYCRAFELDSDDRAAIAYKIGLCYLKGFGVEKDGEEAFEWFDKSAELGSADAEYMLGECYYFGVGIAADAAEAIDAFLRADAIYDESEDEDSELCARICIALAQCYEHGIGTARNYDRAVYYYKKGAESGVEEAMLRAGRAIAMGLGMKPEYSVARPFIMRAARKGYVPAMLTVGMLSDEGRGVSKNLDDAISWYTRVVGVAKEPQMSLYDFPERFAENLKLHTEAKVKALYRLGMLTASRVTDPSEYMKAFEYIAISASMGYAPAQNETARIYNCGGDLTEYFEGPFFVPQINFEGGENAVAKDSLGDAMNKLGDTFYDGKSALKKNDIAAAMCYRYAAELGHIDACYSYGWCLRHGVGVHENDVEAAKWLKMAADRGNANAAYSYGLCCEEGADTGVKNKREAIYYYRMAAGLGHVEAAKRFLDLAKTDK